ncbi:MAG: hypothetical protein JNM56_31535, partial [Planctomycetia bacterium]|nr:hypothetical protein [Planctomycetia bacterium]
LSYNGNNIATVAGLNTDTLTVTFNTAFATTPAVQDLLRALQYARTTGAAGTLDLNFTLTDGDGGTTGLITKPVNIT